MERRLELHEKLCELLGSRNVYFQPPESIKLKYPCIVYNKSEVSKFKADDGLYFYRNGYDVTVITKDPDSVTAMTLLGSFPYIDYSTRFVVDNLYHDVLKLYY